MAKNIGIMKQILNAVYERSPDSSRLQEVSSRLLGMFTEQGELEKKLAADPNLTATGRRNAMKTSVQGFWGDLTWFRQEKRQAGEKITNLHNRMFSLPPSKRSESSQGTRDWEIRTEYRDLDQPSRDQGYLLASQIDDIETLRALQDAPGLTPFITQELRARADHERARRLDPTAYHSYLETVELLEQFQMLARETEDLVKQFEVDVTQVPLTDAEISDRIDQMIEQAFGRDMFMKEEARRQAATQAVA